MSRDKAACRKCRRARRGQSLVEMALVLPLLALLLVGVVDIGRAFHSYIVITNAAREGARYGSRIPQTESGNAQIIETVKREAASGGIELQDDLIEVLPEDRSLRELGTPLAVTVTYSYTTLIGGLVGLREFPMHSETKMVLFGAYPTPVSN